jgi:hypothetical protein
MRRLVQVSALSMMIATTAVAAEPPLQISYPGDGALNCEGLGTEITKVETILGISTDSAARAEGAGRAAELGTSVAINGALYSGALGAVPGLGLFGNAAGGMMKARAAAKAKQAQETIRTAETRRAMLMGMYQGKGCATAAVAAPAAAPVAAQAAPAAEQAAPSAP